MRARMRILWMAGVWLLAGEAAAQTVTVQGMVDVEVVNPAPIEVDVAAPVSVDSVPPVEIAPGQSVSVSEQVFLPGQVLIVQSYRTSLNGPKAVTIPKDMVLRSIVVAPGIVDSDPGLDNCTATVRWLPSDIDPASSDRYLMTHSWPDDQNVALNYPMPFPVLLAKGLQLETSVGRVGTSGFCEALVLLTGTVVPERRTRLATDDVVLLEQLR